MNGRRIIASLAMGLTLATATTTAAWAEARAGWYFGITGGQAEVDLNKSELDAIVLDAFDIVGVPVTAGSSDLEDSDTSLSLFGGYRFSPYVAVEASYVDFGTAEYRASGLVDPIGPQGPLPATYAADFEVKGFTAAAIGTLPLNPMFDLHAHLGVLFADTEITQRASISTFSDSASISSDSQDFFYGVGAGLDLGSNWRFSLDWQQFKDVGDDDETGESDIDRISLGVIFRL